MIKSIIAKVNERKSFVKGIIKCKELEHSDIEEIKSELKSQGVTDVYRFSTKRNGELFKTSSNFLKFNLQVLPEFIKIAFMKKRIEPYVELPTQCFKCHRLGHIAARCKIELWKCGCYKHDGLSFKNPPLCANCGEGYESNNRNCPAYQKEKEVQRIIAYQKLSCTDAKNLVENPLHVTEENTFADIVKPIYKQKPKQKEMS